jgi:hypothetical protein
VRPARLIAWALAAALAAGASWAQAPRPPIPADDPNAFELDLYRTRFDHEIAFRAAAIHVALGAEALCDHTTEIEPFVLWSVHTMRRRLSGKDDALFRRATGMDHQWRVAWADESAPDELKIGDVVVAINGLPLPEGSTRMSLGAVFGGGAIVSGDDEAYWAVIAKAREQAVAGRPMALKLADGRQIEVSTQTGCAGSVSASAFDSDPDRFARQGGQRAKIPAHAMLEARTRDEFRWLAAFGTYFVASATAIGRQQEAEDVGTAFTVGKVLAMALPGAGMLLSAAEARAERAITVDGIVGRADLFANEVVVALGGDPEAGLRLARRIRALGLKADVLELGEFRLSSMHEHVQRLHELARAQAAAPR